MSLNFLKTYEGVVIFSVILKITVRTRTCKIKVGEEQKMLPFPFQNELKYLISGKKKVRNVDFKTCISLIGKGIITLLTRTMLGRDLPVEKP